MAKFTVTFNGKECKGCLLYTSDAVIGNAEKSLCI